MGRNSIARFIAEGVGLLLGLLAGVITARWLGASGKGNYAALVALSGLLVSVCSLGLFEAAIILIGQKKASIQHAVSVTFAVTLVSSLFGATILWFIAQFVLGFNGAGTRVAVALACFTLPLSISASGLNYFLAAQERFVAASVLQMAAASVGTMGIVLFVVVLPLGLAGAVSATAIGAAAATGLGIHLLGRSDLSMRPDWDLKYLSFALRYGLPLQSSALLTIGYLRGDLLLVYSLAGSTAAGWYSVALTTGAVVSLPAIAISMGTFPRIASLEASAANELTAQAFRLTLVATCLTASVTMVALPLVIPFFFGSAFYPSVVPAQLLTAGAVVWSCQWVLCRGLAARGRPGLQVKSFGLSLLLMTLLDLLLIPKFGITAAAAASLAAPSGGLLLCFIFCSRSSWWTLPLKELTPRGRDVRRLATQVFRLLRRRGLHEIPY